MQGCEVGARTPGVRVTPLVAWARPLLCRQRGKETQYAPVGAERAELRFPRSYGSYQLQAIPGKSLNLLELPFPCHKVGAAIPALVGP